MQKYKIRYMVEYETTIECEPGDLEDRICDIDIPENGDCRYVEDTFFAVSICDENGEEVEVL